MGGGGGAPRWGTHFQAQGSEPVQAQEAGVGAHVDSWCPSHVLPVTDSLDSGKGTPDSERPSEF